MILDGEEWILEALIDGKYHFVTRTSPDSYDGDIGSRRVISATLNFNMQVYYFAPIPDKSNIIFNIDVQLLDGENTNIEHKIIDIADNAPDDIIDLFKNKYLGSNVASSLDDDTISQKYEEMKQKYKEKT